MKPTHLRAPRTLDQGHFARGYTTEPAGRRTGLPPRVKAWLHKALTLALFAAIGALLAWRG